MSEIIKTAANALQSPDALPIAGVSDVAHFNCATSETQTTDESLSNLTYAFDYYEDDGHTILDSQLVAIAGIFRDEVTNEQAQRIGNLFAASNEMLQVLELVDAVLGLTINRQYPELFEQMTNALSKARGGGNVY